MRVWLYVLFVALAAHLVACGEVQTEIVESSVQLNTDDTAGPYEITTVVTSTSTPITVRLVYSTDDWTTSKEVEMETVKDVGGDVFRAKIPGQSAGTTVRYYVSVEDSTKNTITDPALVPPQAKGISYKFTIIP